MFTGVKILPNGEILFILKNKLCAVNKSDDAGIFTIFYEFVNEPTTTIPSDEQGINFVNYALSQNKDILAAVTEDKKLLIWKWGTPKKELISTLNLPKRPTNLVISHNNETVLVSDKNGDVYKCDIWKSEKEPALLLGHLSMVLDLAMPSNDHFIISADRDEKIRVSYYPNAYSIHSYCLGHKKLVSRIKLLTDDHLISCSADSTMKLWNWQSGTEVANINLLDLVTEDTYLVNEIVFDGSNNVFLMADSSNVILNIVYNGQTISFKRKLHLHSLPLSLFFDLCGNLNILVKDNEKPVIKYTKRKDDKDSIAQYDSLQEETEIRQIFTDLEVSLGNVEPPSFYTSLVKPCHIKRPFIITPEATINLEAIANKRQKFNDSNGKLPTMMEA